MTRLEALLEMASILAPRAQREITQAYEQPAAYVKKHAKQLEERGIDTAIKELPWFVLIDAAIRAKRCYGIDWKTDVEDFTGALRAISARVKLDDGDPDLDDRSTWELLEIAGKQLADQGKRLGSLDTESDEYNLIVVDAEAANELVRLAKLARYGKVDLFTGRQLAAATKERKARVARYEREAAREAAREAKARTKERYFARGEETWWLDPPSREQRAFSVSYEAPGAKYHLHHYCKKPAEAKAAVARQIDAWRADGFREVSKAEFDALPHDNGRAYLPGYTRPLPEDATYKLESGRFIRCVYAVPEGVAVTAGDCKNVVLGATFGTLVNVFHGADLDQRIAAEAGKPITRDQAVKLLKNGKRPKR